MRLIDADAICSKCNWHDDEHICDGCSLYSAPTVDAVEVVRCRECKHWGKHDDVDVPVETDKIKCCRLAFWMVGENGYCVYGERRNDDGQRKAI